MKPLIRSFPLWVVLAGLWWLFAASAENDVTRLMVVWGLFLVPLAVWLTARAAAVLAKHWFWRIGFWTVTIAGWVALLVIAEGRVESHPGERQNFLLAFGLAGLAAAWLTVKAPSRPTRRVLRDATAGVAVLALAGGAFLWRYDAKTRSIAARAEERWAEIGLPMAEFEKTLAPHRENAGSEVVRQVLRELVSARFYKDGTSAAEREPALERSEATSDLVTRACDIIFAERPTSDDLDLSSQPVGAIKPVGPALKAAYDRILAAEPPTWDSDPFDGYLISVPNFVGIRMFSQLTAADAMRRLSEGDQEGASRALAAGLRVGGSLRQNPTLVSLMLHVAVEALLTSKQVRLPATEDGLRAVAREVITLPGELCGRLQLESWACLRFAHQIGDDQTVVPSSFNALPKWARRITNRLHARRQFAVAACNGAEHIVIRKSPATLALPDFGLSLHEAVSAKKSNHYGTEYRSRCDAHSRHPASPRANRNHPRCPRPLRCGTLG